MLVLGGILAGGAYAWYMWNKPARDVTDEKAIEITATAIFEAYNSDEAAANKQYLDKAVAVTGVVADFRANQVGEKVAILESTDPMFGVNCTFKTDPGQIEKGSTITFKGICKGFLSDVVVKEGVLVK